MTSAPKPLTEPITVKGILSALSKGDHFSSNDMIGALTLFSSDQVSNCQMAAFLMGLSLRGETTDELLGAAQFLRSRMISISVPPECVDIVGTGGDGHHTYNISTAAAFVAAGAGAKVVKHGNRSITSQSGSSDVLAALGVKIDKTAVESSQLLQELGICFLWAHNHHPVMKRWSQVRSDLGIRTIFNLVGPLCNPGQVRRQVVGVYDQKWQKPIAYVLKSLGSEHAWIVHGHDGLDELSTTGPNLVTELEKGNISSFLIDPTEVTIERATLNSLKGGDPKTNAEKLKAILNGKRCPYRDIVLLNAGALLLVAGLAYNIQKGVELAAYSIDKGCALDKLNHLVDRTNN